MPTDGPMDINTGVRLVLKKALQHDGLARGLHEGARAIEKGQVSRRRRALQLCNGPEFGPYRGRHPLASCLCLQAQLCILAEDTDSPDYKKLIEALCAEQNVNLISVPTKLQASKWPHACGRQLLQASTAYTCRLGVLHDGQSKSSVYAPCLQLGEMAGLCRIDAEGNAQKVVACSCAVVTDYGEESQGLNVLREYLKASLGGGLLTSWATHFCTAVRLKGVLSPKLT